MIIQILILKLTFILIAFFFFVVLDEIYREVAFKVDTIRDLRTSCVGGGKIEHDPDKKTIKVYGYSVVSQEINEF